MIRSLRLAVLAAALGLVVVAPGQEQQNSVKIGVLTDMSSLYADLAGPGAVAAVNMAAADFGGSVLGKKIEVVTADHQNKPDVAAAIARQWFDQGVDMITDVTTSSVALAVQEVARDKNKVILINGAASSDLTGKNCAPTSVHWTYDTTALANGTASAVVKSGGKSWFFITADYAFGHALERDTAAVVKENGGAVLGHALVPLNTADFSSYLLQARASKAKIIGLANAGGDTTNSIKQAAEFGIVAGGQKLAGLLLFITDVHALGLNVAQGLNFTETFYWDLNDGTRAFSKRFSGRMKNKAEPTMVQAGVYSGLIHYFKALEAAGGNPHDGIKMVEKMKSMPTDDPLFGKGIIRADGRKIHPAYLFEVKKPSESKGPWDYYKLVGTTPGDQAFRPLSESACPLVKK